MHYCHRCDLMPGDICWHTDYCLQSASGDVVEDVCRQLFTFSRMLILYTVLGIKSRRRVQGKQRTEWMHTDLQ